RSTFDGSDIGFNQTVDAFNYWQQPGDTDVAPSPKYAVSDRAIYYNSDRWLEKGDYIRLRNVTLSYNFPKKYLEKTPLSSLRIYAQGQNLLTFTKFWGDPEVGISSGESISFADTVAPGETTLYSYPNTKSYQMGIDVSF
ncbi:MAG: SusC/RagA family TonB-linked outer membrane protein, partial [Aequorivita sp.]|nr:SusC/RagA family TonB-linked outer membrane protein [Aequorivita sp.]